MKIVWDEPKRQVNLAKHGIDFAEIDLSFFAGAIIRPAKHGRFQALGGAVSVVFAKLGTEGIAIISARPANAKERMLL